MKSGMVNKKGMSDIITNVLIIVLVIAAIGILWTFLKPTIQKGAESTEQAQCFQIDLQAVNCLKNGASNNANVTYKWASGDASLSDVKLVLGKSDGSSTSVSGKIPTSLATISNSSTDFGGAPKEFSVAAVIKTSSGNTITCTPSQAVQCA